MEKLIMHLNSSDLFNQDSSINSVGKIQNSLILDPEIYRRISSDWYIDKNTNFANGKNMNFSEALIQLKKGITVKRKSWDKYLKLGQQAVPALLYKTLTREQKDLLHDFIRDNIPYTLTKEDILAEDWEI